MSPLFTQSLVPDDFSQFEEQHIRSELLPSIGKSKVQYPNGTVYPVHACNNSAYRVVDAFTDSAHCVYIEYEIVTRFTPQPGTAKLYLPQLTLNGTYVDHAVNIIIRNETIFTQRDLTDMASGSGSPIKSPGRAFKGSSTLGPKKRNHPFIISSLYDVFENVGPEVPGMYGLRHAHTTIVTRNEAGESVEWVIRCVAYGGTDIILDVDGVYYLKGRLLALNTKDIQKFYYEPDYQLLANTSENLVCNLANAVSVTGLGIITTRTAEVIEPGKENVHLIVKHSDYNPETQSQDSFDVEYRAMWSKLMEKLQPLMTVGREVMLTGHIVGRNEARQMWIVQVTGVSVTSGPEANPPSTPVDGTATRTTPRGRHRAKMVFPEGDDTPAGQHTADAGHAISPEASGGDSKGKGKAPNKSPSCRLSNKRNRDAGPEGEL
ncbi:hypothetical protein DFH28DRAFT_1124248 [Melampsora americana]|nr:hypothetical protein DFH28DRAFT_1124248 [Melampsora americana]